MLAGRHARRLGHLALRGGGEAPSGGTGEEEETEGEREREKDRERSEERQRQKEEKTKHVSFLQSGCGTGKHGSKDSGATTSSAIPAFVSAID